MSYAYIYMHDYYIYLEVPYFIQDTLLKKRGLHSKLIGSKSVLAFCLCMNPDPNMMHGQGEVIINQFIRKGLHSFT